MRSPRLPTHAADVWECSFLFDTVTDVRGVSCRGGLVVAGGDEIHLLRPGAQRVASRPPPLDIGPVRAAAAEPRAPHRYAIATADLVAVFFRAGDGDQILRLRCGPGGPSATHLAWGRADGESVLYIRWSDGAVVRVKQDMSGVDTTDLPPMDALAADGEGVLAMCTAAPSAPGVYLTPDGENLDIRALDYHAAPSQHVHLAVAGSAVALAVADSGVLVSRATDTPFSRCEPLATAGPIEFEGTAPGAALFGAVHLDKGVTTIVRADAEGNAIRVADFGSDGGHTPVLTALSWDASREMLWAASPQMGLVTCTAPGARHGKRAALS